MHDRMIFHLTLNLLPENPSIPITVTPFTTRTSALNRNDINKAFKPYYISAFLPGDAHSTRTFQNTPTANSFITVTLNAKLPPDH